MGPWLPELRGAVMSDLDDLEELATATCPEPWRQPRKMPGPACSAGHSSTKGK